MRSRLKHVGDEGFIRVAIRRGDSTEHVYLRPGRTFDVDMHQVVALEGVDCLLLLCLDQEVLPP